MIIQSIRNTSRSRMCQPYAKSATERNFSEKAISIAPSVTFTEVIQLPDFGAAFSQAGKRAKSINGRANATANPNIPIAAPQTFPEVPNSTRRKPTIGAVHEKLTNTKVNAIRKIESEE